jgi:hypothetical protein
MPKHLGGMTFAKGQLARVRTWHRLSEWFSFPLRSLKPVLQTRSIIAEFRGLESH